MQKRRCPLQSALDRVLSSEYRCGTDNVFSYYLTTTPSDEARYKADLPRKMKMQVKKGGVVDPRLVEDYDMPNVHVFKDKKKLWAAVLAISNTAQVWLALNEHSIV